MNEVSKRPLAVWVASPPGYPHARAFDEHAHCIHYALGELGMHAPLVWQWKGPTRQRRPIIFAPHLLDRCPDVEGDLPGDAILYNFEQVSAESGWISASYLDRLRQHEVWDYSPKNAAALRELGVPRVKVCPVGYHQKMSYLHAFAPAGERDVDVLFYGSMCPRREAILEQLRDAGANVKHLFGVYGVERDAWIMRSKIVLNLHFYEAKIFEIVRVAHPLANGCLVVSERGADPELEAPLEDAVVFAQPGEIVATCMELLRAAPVVRAELGRRGFNVFSKRSQAEILRPLLCA